MSFQFQQFFIDDHDCAMKVGTDGILLGAWVDIGSAATVLDIGTGSGLIAMMIAQRSAQVRIDAIEIDPVAAKLAQKNVSNGPWPQRIQVHSTSLQDWSKVGERAQSYDIIVCNPPFFSSGPGAPETQRRVARHQEALTLSQLFQCAAHVSQEATRISLILPADRSEEAIAIAAANRWMLLRRTNVRSLPGRPFHRTLLEWRPASSERLACKDWELVLESQHHHRSTEFAALTADFYLPKSSPPLN